MFRFLAYVVPLCVLVTHNAFGQSIYFNEANMSVEFGPNTVGTLNNTSSVQNVIDAPSASSSEVHTQQSHIWHTGEQLEVIFDIGEDHLITSIHFWNYTAENFDVDLIEVKFLDSESNNTGTLELTPSLGGTPIFAEDFAVNPPVIAKSLEVVLKGSNNQNDFQNMGFTGMRINIPTGGNNEGSVVDACIDTDGDGFGWNGVETCEPAAGDNEESVVAACVDTDGDGYGWNGVETCDPTAGDNEGSVVGACVDTDGDGYGWNGVETCDPTGGNNEEPVVGVCIDADGDGFGWNGVETCDPSISQNLNSFFEDFEAEFDNRDSALFTSESFVVSETYVNVPSLSQFNIEGNVDLVRSNDGFGLECSTADGLCIDLDGTGGTRIPVSTLTSNDITLDDGDYVLSFEIGGNDRLDASDTVAISVEPYLPRFEITLERNDSMRRLDYPFSVDGSGTVNIVFELQGQSDDSGPLLDEVRIRTDVPNKRNCAEIKASGGSVGDGLYTIDVDGSGDLDPFEVYCNMTVFDGGWTLFANHKDGIESVQSLDIVDEDVFGVLSQKRWAALRNSLSVGFLFIDENGKNSFIRRESLLAANCGGYYDVDDLGAISGSEVTGFLFHNETTGCTGSGLDYTIVKLSDNRDESYLASGASLYQYSLLKFDDWPYDGNRSWNQQNELLYFLK